MKGLWIALPLFVSTAALADVVRVVDAKGTEHFTGYLGTKTHNFDGSTPTYWAPSAADLKNLPATADARTTGVVSPIKDQGQCGSCWDFSMTKSLESAQLSSGKSFLSLAEQDPLVNDKDDEGCQGGYMDASYWVNHGLAKTADCPYTGEDQTACSAPVAGQGVSWGLIGAADRAPTVQELQAALVKYHVISVTVAAGGNDWSSPAGGVQTDCSNTGVNHMVNLVGYKTASDGSVQFIGANSWGTSWGDSGFFYAAQGCNQLASSVDSALYITVGGSK